MLRQGQVKLAKAYGRRSDGPEFRSPNGETLLARVDHKQAICDNENMKSPRSGNFARSSTQPTDASHVVAGTIEYEQEATLLRGSCEELGIGRITQLKDETQFETAAVTARRLADINFGLTAHAGPNRRGQEALHSDHRKQSTGPPHARAM
jgi:hypothetical protein